MKMKILNALLAIYWSVMFVALLNGYQPHKIVIACSFLLCVLTYVELILASGTKK